MKYFVKLLIFLFSISCYNPPQTGLIYNNDNIKVSHIITPGPGPINSILDGTIALLWKRCEYPKILKVGGMTILEDGRLLISDMVSNEIIIYPANFSDCENIDYYLNASIGKPIDISNNDKHIFILDGLKKIIYQLDYDLLLVNKIPLSFSKKPSKIHIYSQFIFIIDSTAHSIFMLDLKGNLLKKITSIDDNSLFFPIDIISSLNDTYFIIDGIKRKLVHVDSDFIISPSSLNNQTLTQFPSTIQENKDGIIFLNDMVMGKVQILFPNGKTFDQIDDKFINKFSPTAIQLIDNNHIVIFNSNDHSLYFVNITI